MACSLLLLPVDEETDGGGRGPCSLPTTSSEGHGEGAGLEALTVNPYSAFAHLSKSIQRLVAWTTSNSLLYPIHTI